MISIDDFSKVELRAGKILSAEKVPDTDKLLKLCVDFAETTEFVNEQGIKSIISKTRQIVSGISIYFPDPQTLVGRTVMFVANLEPRIIRGLESQGMILAVSTPSTEENPSGGFSLLEPNSTIPPGTKAK